MARHTLTVQPRTARGSKQITFTTIVSQDVTDGLQFAGAGREEIIVQASGASGVTLAVMAAPCAHGRVGGGSLASAAGVPAAGDIVQVVGASEEWHVNQLPIDQFNWPTSTPAGEVLINLSALTGTVKIAIVQ